MIVGLTGGIGSGKTTVGLIFKTLGIPVYEADQASKSLIDTNKELKQKLAELLGTEIIATDGKIDRPKMASVIFNDHSLLKAANALIHPAVGKDFMQWCSRHQDAYLIKEAAILFESGSYRQCDKIVVVTAPQELRVSRTMARGNTTREEVLARMGNQWPQEQKVQLADYVIHNDQSKSLIKQVLAIHENLIRQANPASR